MHNSGFVFLATSLLLETLWILEKKGFVPVILQNLQWSHQNSEEPLLRQVQLWKQMFYIDHKFLMNNILCPDKSISTFWAIKPCVQVLSTGLYTQHHMSHGTCDNICSIEVLRGKVGNVPRHCFNIWAASPMLKNNDQDGLLLCMWHYKLHVVVLGVANLSVATCKRIFLKFATN